MAIQNNGAKMNVVSFTRLDKVALELPPNDPSYFEVYPAPIISALGGRTAPSGGGGMINPQQLPKPALEGDVPRAFVLGSAAPPDRQKDYCNDGGTITATPPPSVTRQENQRGVVDIVGDADLKTINLKPGQYHDA